MRFSILIPIYNRLEITKRGLSLLYDALDHYRLNGNNRHEFDVVVIDDGSTDGSSAWIAGHYKEIHLLAGDGNLWWSGATNKGAVFSIEKLNADYLLLWNDDIAPDKDYFLKVEEVFDQYVPADTVIGSRILSKLTGKTWSIGGFFNRRWGRYGMYNEVDDPTSLFFECDWLPGMGTFVPTSIIRSSNLYWDDRRFPQYHGDSDFTLRCKENGYAVQTCLSLIIYNESDNAVKPGKDNWKTLWTGLVSMRSNYNFRKRLIFYRLHGTPPTFYWGLGSTYFFYIGSWFKRYLRRLTTSLIPGTKELTRTV